MNVCNTYYDQSIIHYFSDLFVFPKSIHTELGNTGVVHNKGGQIRPEHTLLGREGSRRGVPLLQYRSSCYIPLCLPGLPEGSNWFW